MFETSLKIVVSESVVILVPDSCMAVLITGADIQRGEWGGGGGGRGRKTKEEDAHANPALLIHHFPMACDF